MIIAGQTRRTREQHDAQREFNRDLSTGLFKNTSFAMPVDSDEVHEALWTEYQLVADSNRFIYSPKFETAAVCLLCGAVIHQGLVAIHAGACKQPNTTATRSEPQSETLRRWMRGRNR